MSGWGGFHSEFVLYEYGSSVDWQTLLIEKHVIDVERLRGDSHLSAHPLIDVCAHRLDAVGKFTTRATLSS
jgi:hypothetical protein